MEATLMSSSLRLVFKVGREVGWSEGMCNVEEREGDLREVSLSARSGEGRGEEEEEAMRRGRGSSTREEKRWIGY